MKKVLLVVASFCISFILSAQAQNLPGSGKALVFDGSDDQVDLGSFFTLQDFTIDMWIKPGSTQVQYANIIDNNHSGSFTNWVCQQDGNNINTYGFGTMNTGSTFTLTADEWQHLTLVKSSTALQSYVNGILIQSTPYTAGLINYSNNFLRLGNWGGGGRHWNGSMDEVRIWNVALTQTQIRQRMCRKVTSSDVLFANLVAYYNFNESTGITAFDRTANANNGTLINGPSRLTSAAPVGNASANSYVSTGLPSTSLSFPAQDNLSVTVNSGTYTGIAGVHVYRVDTQPNTTSGIEGAGNNDRYFGVFTANISNPQNTAIYNYTGNPFIGTEPTMRLFSRTNNAVTSWNITVATQNETANTFTLAGETAEYMLGSIGTIIPTVSVANKSVDEGNSDTTDMKFSITLNHVYDSAVSVRYKTANKTATAGSDYVAINKVLKFNPGQVKKTVAISVLGDITIEPNEQFNVILINPVNAILGSADTAIGTIRNDDATSSLIAANSSDIKNVIVKLSPNPAKDLLHITGLTNGTSIQVINVQGRVLLKQNISNNVSVNISTLTPGMYIFRYADGNSYKTIKFIKE